jgi:hypothetical protein
LGWGFKNNWYELRWWAKCKYQKFRYGVYDDDVFSFETNIDKFIVVAQSKSTPTAPVTVSSIILHQLVDY